MNIALILAAGTSQRMNHDRPKQFLKVFGKPIVVYTLEIFENHPEIDGIMLVCLDGWQKEVQNYANEYNINKLKWIVTGGKTGLDSIGMGVRELDRYIGPEDIVVLHDANRPMVTKEIISDCIAVCQKHGTGVSSYPVEAAIGESDDHIKTHKNYPRSKYNLINLAKPEAYQFKNMQWAFHQTIKHRISDSISYCTLFIELGKYVHNALGSKKNLRITTPDDLDIFKALLIATNKVQLSELESD